MCLYFGAMNYLIDIVAYCACRVIEISFVAYVMVFGGKTKFLSTACCGISGINICRCDYTADA